MMGGFKEKNTRLKLFALYIEDDRNNKFIKLEVEYTLEDAFAKAKRTLVSEIAGAKTENFKLLLWEIQDAEDVLNDFLSSNKTPSKPKSEVIEVNGREADPMIKELKKLFGEKFPELKGLGVESVRIEKMDMNGQLGIKEKMKAFVPKKNFVAVKETQAEKTNKLMKKILDGKDSKLLKESRPLLSEKQFKYLEGKIKK